MNVIPIVLAAGQGTRMKSPLPKVLHCIDEKPLIRILLETLRKLSFLKTIVVTGHCSDQVKEEVGDDAQCVFQGEQLGTGHAVLQGEALLEGFDGYILVLCGDVPLLRGSTVTAFLNDVELNQWDAAIVAIQRGKSFWLWAISARRTWICESYCRREMCV